jgi:hypothetical protein
VYENNWIIEMHGATIKVTRIQFTSEVKINMKIDVEMFATSNKSMS